MCVWLLWSLTQLVISLQVTEECIQTERRCLRTRFHTALFMAQFRSALDWTFLKINYVYGKMGPFFLLFHLHRMTFSLDTGTFVMLIR